MTKIIISGAITERKNEFGAMEGSFFQRIPGKRGIKLILVHMI